MFINGISVFLNVFGFENVLCEVDIELNDSDFVILNWKVYMLMFFCCESISLFWWYFVEKNYDEFIDYFIYVGIVDIYSFEVDGIMFMLFFLGNNNIDYECIVNDLMLICKYYLDLFGVL